MANVTGADPVTVSHLDHHSPNKQNMGSSSTLSIGKGRELFCCFFFLSLSLSGELQRHILLSPQQQRRRELATFFLANRMIRRHALPLENSLG